jgi:hypothetical protein
LLGATVTITGANFSANQLENQVFFKELPLIWTSLNTGTVTVTPTAAKAEVVSSTATSLTVKVPNGAITGPVTVTTGGGTATSAGSFTIISGRTISGIVSIGPISNATVTAYRIVNGIKGARLATTTTDSAGRYSMQIGTYSGLVLLEVTGGSYKDPATGLLSQLTTVLRSIITVVNDVTVANITPLTEIVVINAYNSLGGFTATNVSTAISTVTNQVGFDPFTTSPINTPLASATTDSMMYEAKIGTISQYLADNAEKKFSIAMNDLAALFNSWGLSSNLEVLSAANNYGANSNNILGLTDRLAPGNLATCTTAQWCVIYPQILPPCPKKPVISCMNGKVPVKGVCVKSGGNPGTGTGNILVDADGCYDASACVTVDAKFVNGTNTVKYTNSCPYGIYIKTGNQYVDLTWQVGSGHVNPGAYTVWQTYNTNGKYKYLVIGSRDGNDWVCANKVSGWNANF